MRTTKRGPRYTECFEIHISLSPVLYIHCKDCGADSIYKASQSDYLNPTIVAQVKTAESARLRFWS